MSDSPKIYFIACCFPPFGRGNAITNASVANHLADRFDVEVLCMERVAGGVISYQADSSLEEGLNPALTVRRVRPANWFGLNIWLYAAGILPCYYLNWAWRAWWQREELIRGPGIVFAVYPVFSDLVLGWLISRRYGLPLLVDFRDDFSGVMSRGWRRIFKPFYRVLEKWVVRQATRITVTTENLRIDLQGRYGLSDQEIETVYNVVPPSPTGGQRPKPTSAVSRVIYAGAMSRVQRPEILCKAHAWLCDRDLKWQERLQIDMYGPQSPYFVINIRKHLGLGRHFGGFKPQVEVAQRVAEADIGFFSLADATYAYATPTKLFDYIEAGVPIVASLPPGAARDLVLRYEIGLVAEAGDVEGLAHCLERMVTDLHFRDRCRGNMAAIRQQFSPEEQVGRWCEILDDMGRSSARGKRREQRSELFGQEIG